MHSVKKNKQHLHMTIFSVYCSHFKPFVALWRESINKSAR